MNSEQLHDELETLTQQFEEIEKQRGRAGARALAAKRRANFYYRLEEQLTYKRAAVREEIDRVTRNIAKEFSH